MCVGEEKEAALPLCVIVRSWVGFLRLFFFKLFSKIITVTRVNSRAYLIERAFKLDDKYFSKRRDAL